MAEVAPIVTAVAAFADNYIWLIRIPGDPAAAVLVDPGDARPAIDALDQEGLKPGAILLTHHHHDHVGGVPALKARYGELPVFGPAMDSIAGVTHKVGEGDQAVLKALGLRFDVFHIPGHTQGHIAYHGHGALFCGDTLFSAGCGRLLGGTAEQLFHSLERLKTLPPATKVYCGHEYTVSNLSFALAVEPDNAAAHSYLQQARNLRSSGRPTLPSTLEREASVNPFLRCSLPAVQESAGQRAGRTLTTAVEVFTVIRHWKDMFNVNP